MGDGANIYPVLISLIRVGAADRLCLTSNNPGSSLNEASTHLSGLAGTPFEQLKFPIPFMRTESGTGYQGKV